MSALEIGAGRRPRSVKTGLVSMWGNQGHPQLVVWEQGARLGGLVLRGRGALLCQEWINKDRGPRNRVVTGDCRTEVIFPGNQEKASQMLPVLARFRNRRHSLLGILSVISTRPNNRFFFFLILGDY